MTSWQNSTPLTVHKGSSTALADLEGIELVDVDDTTHACMGLIWSLCIGYVLKVTCQRQVSADEYTTSAFD